MLVEIKKKKVERTSTIFFYERLKSKNLKIQYKFPHIN